MAYALLLSKTFSANVTGTTFTFTSFGATIPAGTLIDIGVGGNLDTRAGSANVKLLTCADNSTQSGRANIYIPVLPNPGGTTAGVVRVRCFTTRAILTGDTVTVTVTGGSMSRRSAMLTAWSGASATTQIDQTALQSARTVSPITMGATAALAESAAELSLAMSIWRGGAVLSGFTKSAGYTAIAGASSGGTTPNTEVNGSYKVNAGTAAETEIHTFTSFSAGAGKIITYRPTSYTEFYAWPTFTLLDNFNTGANQNLDGRTGWGVAGRVTAGDFSFKTDATPTVAGVSLGTPASNLWASAVGTDHEACATVGAPDTFYLVVRGNTATGNLAAGYLGVIGWSGQVDIRTYSGTVLYTSATDEHPRPAAGDSYCFQAIGSTLTLWRRASGGTWQVLVTIQDSTHLTGTFIGIKGEGGTAVTLTDFGGSTLSSGTIFPQSLSATAVGTASVQKTVGKPMPATAVGTATIQKGITHSLTATAVGVASVQKTIALPKLRASATGTASLVATPVVTHTYFVTLAATAVGTASTSKTVGKSLIATATGTASVAKLIAKPLAATAIGTARITRNTSKSMTATAVGTASVRRGITHSMSATAVGTARLILDYRVPPGGGGFGAEMGGGFLNRYQAGYRGQYQGGYRSRMRKAK